MWASTSRQLEARSGLRGSYFRHEPLQRRYGSRHKELDAGSSSFRSHLPSFASQSCCCGTAAELPSKHARWGLL